MLPNSTAEPSAFACCDGPTGCLMLHGLTGSPAAARRLLPRATAPALVVHSTYDRAVHPRAGERFFALLGSPRKTYAVYARSGHCLLVDSEREAISAQTWQFISSH